MPVFTDQTIQRCRVLTLMVESLTASNAREVGDCVSHAMRGAHRVLVDLGSLRYFDVRGFAAILSWAAGREDREVCLCSESRNIHALFELLRANNMVTLFRSREQALAALAGRTGEIRVSHVARVSAGKERAMTAGAGTGSGTSGGVEQ